MEDLRFDQLTRTLASGASRRRLLKGIGGGAMAGIVGLLRRDADAADKVQICHHTGSATNPVVLIEVSVKAIPAHESHGDVIAPDFENDPENCGGCLISCDDADPCTIDTCVAGECVNTPIVCDDGNVCTDDACVEGECVFTPVEGRECDDNSACTENDACDATGACVGTPVNCDDGDACTTDTCDPATGCVNLPVTCPEGEVCRDGDCVPEECVGGGECETAADCCEGETCVNGICSLPICEGRNCGNFQACTDNPNCLCFIELGGAGVCADGFQCTCGVTCQVCASTDECPDGFVCVRDSCCAPLQVCVPICTLGVTSFSVPEPLEGHTPGSRP